MKGPSDAVLGARLFRSQIFLILVAISTTFDQTDGAENSKPTERVGESNALPLCQVIAAVLAHNPMIRSAQAKWQAAKERVPQAAAWEDPKVGGNIVLGRFVSVPANAFMDRMVSIEQMIPLSGKNRS